MQLKEGASVFTAGEEKAGSIDRVVIDPRTGEVTHIVISKGLILPEDRVVPVGAIASADEDRVILRADVPDLKTFPPFEEINYIQASDEELRRRDYPVYYPPPFFWYPLYGAPAMGYAGYPGEPYKVETERNIPAGTIALKQGTKVIAADGDQVGEVESVLTDPESSEVTHFLISKGLLFKERKLIPIQWVRDADEDQIQLAVGSRLLETLPDYQD